MKVYNEDEKKALKLSQEINDMLEESREGW